MAYDHRFTHGNTNYLGALALGCGGVLAAGLLAGLLWRHTHR